MRADPLYLLSTSLWRLALRVVAAFTVLLLVLLLAATAALISMFGWMSGDSGWGEPTEYVVAAVGEIPPEYLAAYQAAGDRHGVAWQVIAAIGWEETRHGTYGEVVDGCILGPAIHRLGRIRAKGPMQFLDSSWQLFGEDGNGDGASDPCEIGDAPFGTARHLKAAPGGEPIDYAKAVYAYNHSHNYVARVLNTAHSYGWNRPAVADPSGGDWYRYQGEASSFDAWGNEGSNCGPASVAMAIEWVTGLHLPVREVRGYLGENGATTLDQLARLLSHWGVRYRYTIADAEDIKAVLARGNVTLIGLSMSAINPGADIEGTSTSPALRTGRYSDFAGMHWLLVKGITPDGRHFIVHDPNVWGRPGNHRYWYSDGSPKGKDRLYRVDEVNQGMMLFSSHPGSRAIEVLGAVTVPGSSSGGGQ